LVRDAYIYNCLSFVYIAIPIVILTLPFAASEYLYINKQPNVLFLYGYAAFVFLTIILTLLMRSLLTAEGVLYGGKLIEEFMRLWGNNPTTSLDLEPWLMSLSVRQESPVVSLLYPCHQPKRLSNRVGF
jgi:hypothetical protein